MTRDKPWRGVSFRELRYRIKLSPDVVPILTHMRLDEPEPVFLTSSEAAALLGVSRPTVAVIVTLVQ